MSADAIFWTALTTVVTGLLVITSKVVVERKFNPNANLAISYVFSFVIFLIIYIYSNPATPNNVWLVIFLALCSGIFYASSFLTRVHSFSFIDSVLFLPINKILGPIIVVLGSFILFGEKLTFIQIIGVVFSVCIPLLLISKHEQGRQKHLRLGLSLLVISTLFGVASNFLTKISFEITGTLLFFYVWQQFFMIVYAFIYYFYENHKSNLKFSVTKDELNLGLLTGVLSFLTVYTWMKALEIAPLGLLYTIHAHYILIPIIFSVVYYKEHIDLRKLVAVVLSMVAIGFLI